MCVDSCDLSRIPGKFRNYVESLQTTWKLPDNLESLVKLIQIPGKTKNIPTIIVSDIYVAFDITIKWASYVPYLEVYSGRVGRFQETDSSPFCALMYGGWGSGLSKMWKYLLDCVRPKIPAYSGPFALEPQPEEASIT